jgi:hypothetical protein
MDTKRILTALAVIAGIGFGVSISFAPSTNAVPRSRWVPGVGRIDPDQNLMVDPSVIGSILQPHWVVTTQAQTVFASLDGYRSTFIYNDSAVNCCFTFDGSAPVTTATGCTAGTPHPAKTPITRDYGLVGPINVACSGTMTAATGDIAAEITK